MATAAIALGASSGIETDLIVKAGGLAGVFALLTLLVILPLFLSQRREIRRLQRWHELEPDQGDSGPPQPPAALAGPAAPTGAAPTGVTPTTGSTAVARPGELSPLERVTGERPALGRTTGERPPVERPSFWSRLISRGPRHPLILSAVAILLAVAAVVVVSLNGNLGSNEPAEKANAFDRAAVELVVLNGSSQPSLAGKVADGLAAAGFEQVRTGATGTSKQTVVLFAKGKGNKRAAMMLKRELNAQVIQPLDNATQAAAPGAQVVVIAGEDRAKA